MSVPIRVYVMSEAVRLGSKFLNARGKLSPDMLQLAACKVSEVFNTA